MVLKRKRSDSEISNTSSILSSPLSNSNSNSNSNFMAIDSFSASQIQTSSLFSSRTRKRYRDNRPDENSVHQHTLNLLFSAQQGTGPQYQSLSQQPSESSMSSSQEPVSSLPSSTQSSIHQSSLHSFWALPNARSSSPSSINSSSSANTPTMTPHPSLFQPTNCEDCDASLTPENDYDAMDVDMMMDVDSTSGANHACSACGKVICHSCAVSNLGAERKCLLCAGKKKWGGVLPTMFRRVHNSGDKCEGGLGWVSS